MVDVDRTQSADRDGLRHDTNPAAERPASNPSDAKPKGLIAPKRLSIGVHVPFRLWQQVLRQLEESATSSEESERLLDKLKRAGLWGGWNANEWRNFNGRPK